MTGENTCLNMQLPSTEQRYEMEPVFSVSQLKDQGETKQCSSASCMVVVRTVKQLFSPVSSSVFAGRAKAPVLSLLTINPYLWISVVLWRP